MKFLTKTREKKNGKKGFTLVELIVVLVILAILMAILIPAMTGWITKAREKAVVVEGRTAYLAAQTLASEEFGKGDGKTAITVAEADVIALAGVKGTVSGITINTDGVVTGLTYQNGKTAIYKDGTWTVDGKDIITGEAETK